MTANPPPSFDPSSTVSPTRARGGKTVFGAAVGILMLDTRFPRVPGDMGNAATWPFPVLYRVVRGATPDKVVRHRAAGLDADFMAAARDLVADGADGITTTCGFLALMQADLAAAAGVPVASSSLMQVPMVQSLLPPGRRPGILTISKSTLTEAHLTASGVPLDTPVVGTDDGREFTRAVLDDEPEMDVALARQDLLAAGTRLVREHAGVGAIVLECTNMVPYAADLRQALGLPVFSIYTFVQWFQSALLPRAFDPRLQDPRVG
ncbi:MAG: aspartate/glutamate racemase family protein [Hyphomicrobiales bacterium]|nr:aspartate/glutamate racemase family protein [Hyphomicrobiales bacterium]